MTATAKGLKQVVARIAPRSLFGRLVLILLTGMLLSHIASYLIFVREHRHMFAAAQLEQLVRRVVDITRVLERTSVHEREGVASAFATRVLRVRSSAPPNAFVTPALTDQPPEFEVTAQAIARALRESGYEMRETALFVAPVPPLESNLRQRQPPKDDTLHPHPPPEPMHAAMRFVVGLADGSTLHYEVSLPRGEPRVPARTITADLLLRGTIIVLVCLFAVRLVTRPVRTLGAAAERLGEDLNTTPMAETGTAEVRAAARAFNQMQKKLQTFISERTRMLAAVSHDLKTPITRMRLRAEQINDETLREKFATDLGEMESLVADALALMQNLDVTRAPRQSVDLEALVDALIADRNETGQHITRLGNAARPVSGWPQALKRCIDNLLDNACKYGGEVNLKLLQTPSSTSVIVSDNGPGIPQEELERVFEPFFRLEGSRNRATGGNGLGLSISRGIARAHGGDVTLRNIETGGLEACLTLKH